MAAAHKNIKTELHKVQKDAPAGNQTRVSSVAGTYTITVLPAHQGVFVLGFEPRISRVLGERHNQARPYEQVYGVSGFRSQYLVLAKHARFRLRQYPIGATPGGFEPPRAEPTHLAGEPLNHSGKVSRAARSGNTAAQKNSFVETKNKKRKYACRDSNSGFPACEAGVITRLDHTRTPRQPWQVRCRNPSAL